MTDFPNYAKKLARAAELGLLKPGEVGLTNVAHDDDCAHWNGGICDCDPEITITVMDTSRVIRIPEDEWNR